MKKALPALFLTAALLGGARPTPAAEPTLIGSYDGWKAYHFLDQGKKVCFMSRAPEKQEGNFKKRGSVLLFVTRWSGEKDRNVVSLAGGYPFKEKAPVSVQVKGHSFDLFSQGEMAWTKDGGTDDALVKEMRAGATMIVKGTSARGTATTDTYGLKGTVDAYDAISKECSASNETTDEGKKG